MTQLAQGSEPTAPQVTIEGPVSPKAEVAIRREPVPRELAAMGLVLGIDPDSGMQRLIVPPELSEKANVLTPIQMFQQVDQNWRPSLRVVNLNPSPDGPHFYKQGKNLAPRKQALELLADAAGVVQVHTQMLGRERVEVGDVTAETFTHLAILRIRKSDGTLRTLEASRTYEPFAEYEEIRTSVGSGQYAKTPGSVEYDAEVRKRWLNEIKFAKAKNESKAINRAARSALQIPHTFTATDAAKPFVVVGWNLAPQDSAAVHAAIAQLYGAAPEALEPGPVTIEGWDAPEEVRGEIEDSSGDGAVSQAQEEGPRSSTPAESAPDAQAPVLGAPSPEPTTTSPAESPAPEREPAMAGDGPGAGTAVPPPVSPSEDSPGTETPLGETAAESGDEGQSASAPSDPEAAAPSVEPTIPGTEAAPSDADLAALGAALQAKIPTGSYQQRTLKWVLALGEAADEWLAYALRQPWPHDKEFKVALTLVVRVHRPELYAALEASA